MFGSGLGLKTWLIKTKISFRVRVMVRVKVRLATWSDITLAMMLPWLPVSHGFACPGG